MERPAAIGNLPLGLVKGGELICSHLDRRASAPADELDPSVKCATASRNVSFLCFEPLEQGL